MEEELLLIRQLRPRAGFPNEPLLEALPEPDLLIDAAHSFTAEVVKFPGDHSITTFTSTAKHLSSLHSAAQALRGAVEWASNFTAIDWWVGRRATDLGIGAKTVLLSPGKLGDFSIERQSRFLEVLLELGGAGLMLSSDDGGLIAPFQSCAAALQDVHLLRVPPSDGISPLWHPLILGHELSHLRWTDKAIREWLASREASSFDDLVGTAIEGAIKYQDLEGDDLFGRSKWQAQLERWLVEVACDFTALRFYEDAGGASLEAVLAAYSSAKPSATHPPMATRVAIQSAVNEGDLASLKPDDPYSNPASQATAALIQLVLSLKEHVFDALSAGDPLTVEQVAQSSYEDLGNGLIPSSSSWPVQDLPTHASAIECGLVQALWKRRADLNADLPKSEVAMLRDAQFVSQAIDALEFASRFEARRQALGVTTKQALPLPNVLWLSENGVATNDGGGDGVPSHDLRLGRYFTVFQRNSVAGVEALGGGRQLAQIQREVEVGWGGEFVLHPLELVLAVTFESLRLDLTCSAQVLSRSTLGRLGLLSATAVQVQPGYRGCLTLELVNLSNVPLTLSPGQRVAQIVPLPVAGGAVEYQGRYQDSGAKPSYGAAQPDWEDEILRTIGSEKL